MGSFVDSFEYSLYFFTGNKNCLPSKISRVIVDELESKKELKEQSRLFDRQTAINQMFNLAIQGLNAQTCSIDGNDGNMHLCDSQLEIRLRELLDPVLSYTDVLLDTSAEKKFTIGLHLNVYQKLPANINAIELVENGVEGHIFKNWDSINDGGIVILKDELGFSDEISKDLLQIESLKGAPLQIQFGIKMALGDRAFAIHTFESEGKEYTIVATEILEVCSDEEVNGAFFIIHANTLEYPEDLAEVFGIFNRITANYVSKYNDCIINYVRNQKNGRFAKHSQL